MTADSRAPGDARAWGRVNGCRLPAFSESINMVLVSLVCLLSGFVRAAQWNE